MQISSKATNKFWYRVGFINSFSKWIFISFVPILFSEIFSLVGPYLSKLLIDNSLIVKDSKAFFRIISIGVVIFMFSTIFNLLKSIILNKIFLKVKLNLYGKFLTKFYSLDINFLKSKSCGEHIHNVSNVEAIIRFLVNDIPNTLINIMKVMIIFTVAFLMNAHLALLIVILSPLFLMQGLFVRVKIAPILREIWNLQMQLLRKINESFFNIAIIKAMRLEHYQRRVYLGLLIRNIRLGLENFKWNVLGSISSNFISKVISGIISIYCGWLIIKGRLSLGSYAAIIIYLGQLTSLLQDLNDSFKNFASTSITLDNFFEIMNREPLIKNLPAASYIRTLRGDISFKNLLFGYDKNRPILKYLNFQIPSGKWVGIVGFSGSGKTTIVNLILRLYDPWEGEVLLDGINLKKIRIESLKNRIAVAMQEPFLFDISIRENITYGLKPVSSQQVEEVADIVQINDFIKTLSKGYDTEIGESANKLSQGYKQRVALARAIIRNPDILILDEATSSIDSFTEQKIFSALRKRREGKTTIIISHRLFSITDTDNVYFLRRDGEMEEGEHIELVSKSNFYYDFFQHQIKSSPELPIASQSQL